MSMTMLGLRALLFRSRTLALALLPLIVGAVSLALAVAAQPTDLRDAYPALSANLLVSLVVALVCLVLGVNAFDDERDGGTMPLLMATATPRWRIVVAKLVAAWLAALVVSLPAVLGVGVLGQRAGFPAGEVWSSLFGTLVLSCAAYVALFVLLSLLTARALLVGLGYIVVWEGSFATYVTSLRNLSIGAYGRRLVGVVWPTAEIPFKVPDIGVTGGGVVLLVVLLVGTGLAVWRLPHIDATSRSTG